jgi:hypothetical protein
MERRWWQRPGAVRALRGRGGGVIAVPGGRLMPAVAAAPGDQGLGFGLSGRRGGSLAIEGPRGWRWTDGGRWLGGGVASVAGGRRGVGRVRGRGAGGGRRPLGWAGDDNGERDLDEADEWEVGDGREWEVDDGRVFSLTRDGPTLVKFVFHKGCETNKDVP